jgi:hypothetical protein
MLFLSCKGTKYNPICYEKIGGNLIALWPGGINLILICWNRSLSKSICLPKNFTQSSAEVLAEFRRVSRGVSQRFSRGFAECHAEFRRGSPGVSQSVTRSFAEVHMEFR